MAAALKKKKSETASQFDGGFCQVSQRMMDSPFVSREVSALDLQMGRAATFNNNKPSREARA